MRIFCFNKEKDNRQYYSLPSTALCNLSSKQPRLFKSSIFWHSRDSPLRRTSCSNKKRTIPGTNPSPSAILRTPSSVSNDRGRPRFKRMGTSGKHSEGGLRISD
ncbi:hypothetical protein CDAR_462271 [Caerostris darwini]|uniref:Uncharacterized protein n=1 Tax=Caerostris darwini TaxID=1538125 RepID=A0AAV4U0Y3_9ARAC|nr:hypothetical protein CDAR_462271 [Caerostris darwini]